MEFQILKKRLDIGRQFDDFLDKVSEAGLLFKSGVDAYLSDNIESFEKKIEDIIEIEHFGDALRRDLEETLYVQTLIPESRGDVLELLENMDALLDRFKGALWQFNIERPLLFNELIEDFRELVNCVVEAVEAIVLSSRAFFKDIKSVADHIHKVPHWETQSDKIESRIQQTIFRQEGLELSHKMQLRDFVKHVDKIADRAEDVSDKLRIFVIKRSL
jgi:predicted phosphate transport protein (TIGR00153 family)